MPKRVDWTSYYVTDSGMTPKGFSFLDHLDQACAGATETDSDCILCTKTLLLVLIPRQAAFRSCSFAKRMRQLETF